MVCHDLQLSAIMLDTCSTGTMFDHYGLCWIIVDSFGPFGTFWDHLGQCWTFAIAICLSHSNLEPFGEILSHLEPNRTQGES